MGSAPVLNGAAARPLSQTEQLTIGVLFLALCGWKFTVGLSRVMDLDVSWHEARYIAWVTQHTTGLMPPEFLISFTAMVLYAGYRAYREERVDWRIAAAIPLAAAVLAPVWWTIGLPLFNARSMEAFARHFALNYVAWQHLGEDPVTADYLA